MQRARIGSTVTVQYVGTLANGRIFDSTTDEEPLTFTIGANQVFPALEQAVDGMAAGEVRNIVVAAADAFGPRLQENIIRVERSRLPAEKEIRVGQKLGIQFAGGQERVMLVTEVDENQVTLDGNHPLAGLDLTFALRLDGITEPS
ncbi:MAG: peptidylprolyl isomerase [Geobacter sp.]|nr:peptidylprolyl isomerase [Geobacter sp.]